MDYHIKDLLDTARNVALEGGRHTLRYFRREYRVERKDDQSPVTIADRETEELMRAMIRMHHSDHGIIGEEKEAVNPDSEVQWILDPIDGTHSFVHGIPLYTTLVGVTIAGRPVAGVIHAPALDEIVEAAEGYGARYNGEPCQVSKTDDLEEAVFLTTDPAHCQQYGYEEFYRNLAHSSRLHRTWGDAYGHIMVATGRADIMFEPVLNVWDAAPLLPVIREAGGRYTDLQGQERVDTGNALSTNGVLHDQLLEMLSQYQSA